MKNLLFVLSLLALAWLGTIFWDSPAELFFPSGKTRVQSLPTADSYMKNILTTQYDNNGTRAYRLDAKGGLYYLEDDRFELDTPHLVAQKRDTATPWQLTAKSASTGKSGAELILRGDVRAWQTTERGRSEFFTDHLAFTPSENRATTTAAVEFVHPEGATRGIGMDANFTTEVYHLLAAVEGKYHGH